MQQEAAGADEAPALLLAMLSPFAPASMSTMQPLALAAP